MPTIGRILSGKISASKSLDKIAAALEVPVGVLYGEAQLEVYSLDTAPLCESDYYLGIDGKSLLLPFLPEGHIECVIVPWDDNARENAIRALYRRKGQKRAFVATVESVGDDVFLYPASIGSSHDPLPHTDNQILGAIYDVVSLSTYFHR